MTRAVYARAVATWLGESGPPRAELVPPLLRRRTSTLTRMVAHVLAELGERGGVDLANVPVVHGTALGEIATTVELLDAMFVGDGALSPTRFTGSVHNTAAGVMSIALGNRSASTTVSAGARTTAMCLVEAFAQLAAGESEVVLVVADEPVPAPLDALAPWGGLAVAIHLARAPTRGQGGAKLVDLGLRRPAPAPARVPASVADNPVAPALALARALEAAQDDVVALERVADPRTPAWCVTVEPPSR
jgi:hypothetical protein